MVKTFLSRRNRRSLYGAVAFVLTLLIFYGITRAQNKNQMDTARQSITSILSDPVYMKLDTNIISWKANESGKITLPEENPDHPEGVFQMTHTDISEPVGTLPDSYSIDSFGWSRLRVVDFARLLTREQCQENSLVFIKRQFPWFFSPGTTPRVRVDEPNWNRREGRGVRFFHWFQENEEGLPHLQVDTGVRVADGKVVEFSALIMDWTRHKARYHDVEIEALRLASADTNVRSIEVIDQSVFKTSDNATHSAIPLLPRALFQIDLQGVRKKTQEAVYARLYFDADTGKSVWISYLSGKTLPQRADWGVPRSDVVDDSPTYLSVGALPVWVNTKLFFVSGRPTAQRPEWAPSLPQLALQDATGTVSHITQEIGDGHQISGLYSTPFSSWVAMERGGWTYAINTINGDYRVIGTPSRGTESAIVSPDGKWAVVSASGHEGAQDSDLFADNLERSPELALRARLVIPQSDEHHPIFSPDGKWLYFVSGSRQKDKYVESLKRLPTSLVFTKKLQRLKPEQIETVIATLPTFVGRLSIFPDGQHLLIQDEARARQKSPAMPILSREPATLFLVSLTERRVTKISLPVLKDKEQRGLVLQDIDEAWAGPGNDEITFSAGTQDANKTVRQRLYSCRFDGTNLKALTSQQTTPVPAYKFDQGKTAFQFTKELALSEVTWEAANDNTSS